MRGEKIGRLGAGIAGMLSPDAVAVAARVAAVAAAIVVILSGVLAGTAQAAASDTSKVKTAAVDTSAKTETAAVSDTSKTSVSIDTLASSVGADSLTNANDSANAVDTAGIALMSDSLSTPDTAGMADTVSSLVSADSALIDGDADTAAAVSAADSIPLLQKNKLLRYIVNNIAYIFFFCISLAVIIITVFFFTNKQETRRFLTTTRLSVLDKMVQKACRYIESNYADPDLTVSAVCRELVTGEAYLDTLFLKEIGIDVLDFIAQVRVNRIKNLLAENSAADIEAVYKQCGFTDKAAVDRCFAKLCGGVGIEVYAKSLMSAGKTPEA